MNGHTTEMTRLSLILFRNIMRAGQRELRMTDKSRFRQRVLQEFRQDVESPIEWEKKYQSGLYFLQGPPRLGGLM